LKIKVERLEVDVGYLRKGYWIQALLGAGTFLAVIGLIAKLAGVI